MLSLVKISEDKWFNDTNMDEIFKQERYELVGAAMEVYNVMGPGYLEDVYQECLERELTLRAIPFENQPKLSLFYKGEQLNKYYRPDLYAFGGIVAELNSRKWSRRSTETSAYQKCSGKLFPLLRRYLVRRHCPRRCCR